MRHGTRSAYVKHRCRCAACRRANADYQTRWARNQRRPDPMPATMIAAAGARAHLGRLEASGWSRREIARCTGLSRTTLDTLASGARHRIRLSTHQALLALAPAAPVDAGQATALVDALGQSGYRLVDVARACGRERLRFRAGRPRRDTYRRLVAVFLGLGGELSASGDVVAPPLPRHLAASVVPADSVLVDLCR